MIDLDPSDDEAFAAALNAAAAWLAEIAPEFDLDNLDPDEARELLEIVAERAAEDMREDALDLLSELEDEPEADFAAFGAAEAIGKFFAKAKKTLRTAYLAAALAVLGPDGIDATAQEAVGVQIARQGAYLRAFEQDVRSGGQPPDGTLASRAEMYGAASHLVGQNVGQSVAGSRGMVDERRVLGEVLDHCDVCPAQAALGWQPVGTLLPIGESPCRIRCVCRYEWRDEDGVVYERLPEA